ncbi:unnamed protein product [Citrullus colocynthis]|uniref:Uncharacterized protein n=1 Tax=Citrullus colocynthis TaxID=252529 RepID=A0ABP0Y6X0_9ROSI
MKNQKILTQQFDCPKLSSSLCSLSPPVPQSNALEKKKTYVSLVMLLTVVGPHGRPTTTIHAAELFPHQPTNQNPTPISLLSSFSFPVAAVL